MYAMCLFYDSYHFHKKLIPLIETINCELVTFKLQFVVRLHIMHCTSCVAVLSIDLTTDYDYSCLKCI